MESGGAQQYFSLADYLTEDEAARFFELSHAQQVAKVAEYLDFLGRQPAAQQFKASARAAVAGAQRRDAEASVSLDEDLVELMLEGKTRSGFGAFGTEEAFLPQKQLSLQVAGVVEEIGHEYAIEKRRRTKGSAKQQEIKPVLNSRSFFFYWCHAEKQKLVDVRQKLSRVRDADERKKYWEAIEIVVDRAMCDDCVAFCTQLAKHEGAELRVLDPQGPRVFQPRTVS